MVNLWVKLSAEEIKQDYLVIMKNIGYGEVEEDLTSDGRWHDDYKQYGKIGFWKEKPNNGIIISRGKIYNDDGSVHVEGVFLTEDAMNSLKDIGYEPPNPIIKRKETLNGLELDVLDVDSCKFYEFVKKFKDSKPAKEK